MHSFSTGFNAHVAPVYSKQSITPETKNLTVKTKTHQITERNKQWKKAARLVTSELLWSHSLFHNSSVQAVQCISVCDCVCVCVCAWQLQVIMEVKPDVCLDLFLSLSTFPQSVTHTKQQPQDTLNLTQGPTSSQFVVESKLKVLTPVPVLYYRIQTTAS